MPSPTDPIDFDHRLVESDRKLPNFSKIIRTGDVVVCGQATAEPLTLTGALVDQAANVPPFKLIVGPVFSDTFRRADIHHISFASYGVIGNTRAISRRGALEIIPSHYSAFCEDFARGHHRVDVVLVQLAELNGRLSASLSNDYVLEAARRARVVIAEINPDAPWTYGAEWPDDIEIHYRVRARVRPIEFPSAPLDDVAQRIACQAVNLIADESTLQFGVGKIPDAILSNLTGAKNLGIHSGLISDVVVDLLENGTVTNTCKGLDLGITVTNTMIGTNRLYRFAHANEAIAVRAASYTHSHQVLSRIKRFVAINSALQVGLDGSVNAETIKGVQVGAIGGQVDFVRGANASLGGRAIIALPATAPDGSSRIVPQVETVTTSRADVDAVVTEWGIAELRCCSISERNRRMIAIAAPEHQDALERSLHEARSK